MKLRLIVFCYLITLLFLAFNFQLPIFGISAECDQAASNISTDRWDACVSEYQKEAAALGQANATNKSELANLEKQLSNLKQKVQSLSQQLTKLEADIKTREVDLGLQQELLGVRIRSYYIRSRYYSPFLLLLSSRTASNLTRELALRETVTNQDKAAILSLSAQISKLKTDKEAVARNKTSLASLQKTVDERASFLAKEIGKTETYLAVLSAKQQEILAAKSGGFTASVGDSELADDYNASIKGFRESAPSGSYAVFSFGAHTHRKGMSQYGARGRAQVGQDYKAILKAYYGKEPVSKDTGGNINVSGFGSINFEEKYLYGIAEMPSSWPSEVLKAQAIAARTYAYRYKLNGQSICTTESCQVFSKSKSDNPPQAWKDAVNATRGLVIEDVVTYYASTHGGYITTMGWDTTDGNGGSNFLDKSYEKLGGSPWVYKAWYTKEYSVNSDKCGRSNPWLTATDLADIVNAALVLKNKEDSRITPTTTSCWGGNPYSQSELRNVASQYGGINSVDSVSVIQGVGTTNEVVINGSIRLSGADFKKAFNLRAPGYVKIPQSGFSFFNIEKK
jgi:peptidoglycan hydrolase CwlO-like protein